MIGDTGRMLEKLNPPGVHETAGYSHVTFTTAESRLAHLAGQCPLDLDGKVVGEPGDFDAQTDDVIRSVIYVVSPDSSVLGGVWHRLAESPLAPAFTTASTLLGVAALGYEGQLIEIDLTAAL
jgi:enamine deaminase RidA (YjgF/YER057c/UK114 family)